VEKEKGKIRIMIKMMIRKRITMKRKIRIRREFPLIY